MTQKSIRNTINHLSKRKKTTYLFQLQAISLQKACSKAQSGAMKLFLSFCSLCYAVVFEVSDNPLTVSAKVSNIQYQGKVLPRIPCPNLQLFGKTNRTYEMFEVCSLKVAQFSLKKMHSIKIESYIPRATAF